MTGEREIRVLAIDCSPSGPGRTATALAAILAAGESAGAATELLHLGGADATPQPEAVAKLNGADAFVFGSPMYRATFSTPFKSLLDATPRGMWGETEAPLTARAVAIVATGASDHHFLGLASMRNVLVDFFAAQVLSPGLYLPHTSFTEDRQPAAGPAERARLQGVALVELARAIAGSTALGAIEPQA